MTGMEALSQILLRLTYQDSGGEYALLCRAIEEAAAMQPSPPAMDVLCKRLADAGAGQDPEVLRRLLVRAADRLWENPDVRQAFGPCVPREPGERPAPEALISTAARHLLEQSRRAEETFYEITLDAVCRRYGIVIFGRDSLPAALLPALTGDRRRLERIVEFLYRYRIPPEALKDDYVSGRLWRDLK